MELKNNEVIKLKNINYISVVMFGLLGDVFMRTPVLKALKTLYPDAFITVFVDKVGSFVLENNPYCDKVFIVHRSKKNKFVYYASKIKMFIEMYKSNADLVVDLYNGGSSPMSVFLSFAKYRLGYGHQKDAKFYNILSTYIPYENTQVDSYNKQIISILDVFTREEFSIHPIYRVSDSTYENIDNYLSEICSDRSKLYVLNLGSGGVEKLLDNKLYMQLVEYIYETYGYYPAIVNNPSQEYLQKEFIENHIGLSNIPYLKLKYLSIGEVGALLELTGFIITPDTGLMHLAFAMDTFVYTTFTYTNPKLVDLGSEKFFPVFEDFGNLELYKEQSISYEMMKTTIDKLFEKLST